MHNVAHTHTHSHTHTYNIPSNYTLAYGTYNTAMSQTGLKTGGADSETTSESSVSETAAGGTGNTGTGATANTWRPEAYNCIICSKN